jgi:hypothetical protein
LDLLKSEHPEKLFWREIVAELFPSYETKYRDKKTFGSAISNRLAILDGKHLEHEGDEYGILGSSVSGKVERNAKQTTFPYPRIDYHILPRELPNVRFDLENVNDYPVRIRIRVRTILGNEKLGLIEDSSGRYNGKTEIRLEPGGGWKYGNFSMPEKCIASIEDIVLEVRLTVADPDGKEHRLFPKSWTYKRDQKTWIYAP